MLSKYTRRKLAEGSNGLLVWGLRLNASGKEQKILKRQYFPKSQPIQRPLPRFLRHVPSGRKSKMWCLWGLRSKGNVIFYSIIYNLFFFAFCNKELHTPEPTPVPRPFSPYTLHVGKQYRRFDITLERRQVLRRNRLIDYPSVRES